MEEIRQYKAKEGRKGEGKRKSNKNRYIRNREESVGKEVAKEQGK
jgi:hypothetical protein